MGTRPRIKTRGEKVYAVNGRQNIYRTERKVVATGLMVAMLWGNAVSSVVATPQEVSEHPYVSHLFKPQYV